MNVALFQTGRFTLHSGATSLWKIECDAFTDEDWTTLAILIATRVPTFGSVEPATWWLAPCREVKAVLR